MNLVFFGTPDFAIPTLNTLYNSPHNILRVVTIPDKKSGRGLNYYSSSVKKYAKMLNIPILEPNNLEDKEFLKELELIKPDIYIVVAFRILPKSLLKIPLRGAVNLHASLLPKYRGAAPINHAILNGEKTTGVTTFYIKQKVDTGDILLQHKINIYKDSTAGELMKDLANIGAEIMLKTLDGISNNSITIKEQNHNISSLAPKINIDDCQIKWNQSAEIIHNHIRAFTPTPGAFTFYNSKRIKLYKSNIEDICSNYLLNPGQIHFIKPYLIVGTNSNYIKISELQPEGKRKLTAIDFKNSNPDIEGGYFV